MSPDKVFFTADTHFGHSAMIRLGIRGFADPDEMDAVLIQRWNSIVPHDGHVFHLGDVSFRKTGQTADILARLKGRKYLLEGNHDKGLARSCKDFFEWTKPYHEQTMNTIDGPLKVVMSHYAFRSWNQMHYGSWNLHGHSHGNLKPMGKQADVGVDCWNLGPVSFLALYELLNARQIVSEDHHQPRPTETARKSSLTEESK